MAESETREGSELIDRMTRWVAKLGEINQPQDQDRVIDASEVLANWVAREAHLAVRRAHEMMADGVPPDTAFFLSVDDLGFQVAYEFVRISDSE
jgi:hypothetical protein